MTILSLLYAFFFPTYSTPLLTNNPPQSILLTKEDWENHITKQHEQTAKDHGMTIEEWNKAVLTQQVVTGSFV